MKSPAGPAVRPLTAKPTQLVGRPRTLTPAPRPSPAGDRAPACRRRTGDGAPCCRRPRGRRCRRRPRCEPASGITSSSQAATTTARNSRPFARCIVPMRRATGLDFGARCRSSLAVEVGRLRLQLGLAPSRPSIARRRRSRPAARPRCTPRLDPLGDRRSSRPRPYRGLRWSARGRCKAEDCAAADVRVAVDVAHLGRQEQVGLAANLVRGAVVDAQGARPAAHVDAEREPGERRLEDALAEVAGEEQSLFRLTPRSAARKRSCGTLMSWLSSTTMKSYGLSPLDAACSVGRARRRRRA